MHFRQAKTTANRLKMGSTSHNEPQQRDRDTTARRPPCRLTEVDYAPYWLIALCWPSSRSKVLGDVELPAFPVCILLQRG
jgi:hypothetical protein